MSTKPKLEYWLDLDLDPLVRGECGVTYKRCIWTICRRKQRVWRCVSQLELGKEIPPQLADAG